MEVFTLALPIGDALQYMHSMNRVHLDLKQANVLIEADNELKLSDFGLAQIFHSTASLRRSELPPVAGTRPYADPHYIHTGVPHPKNDQYAFGMMIFQWLTGLYCPQRDRDMQGIPPKIQKVVSRMLEFNPDKRYDHIKDAVEDLGKACYGSKWKGHIIQEQKNNLKGDNKTLKQDKRLLQDNVGKLEREKQDLQEKVGKLERDKKALQNRFEHEKQDLQEKVGKLEHEKQDLQGRVEKLERDKQALQNKFEHEKQDLQGRVEKLERDKQALQNKFEQDKQNLQKEINSINRDKPTLQDRLEHEKRALQERAGKLEQEKQALQDQVRELEQKNSQIGSQEFSKAIEDYSQENKVLKKLIDKFIDNEIREKAIRDFLDSGEEHRLAERYKEARDDYSQVLALDENHARARELRGRMHLALGANEEALEDLKQAIESGSASTITFYSCGVAYQRLNQLTKALKCYDRAIEQDDTNADAFARRGQIYLKRGEEGDIDRALLNLTRAIELDNNDDISLTYRGQIYLERGKEGDIDRALSDFTQAILLNSTDDSALTYRGQAYLKRGRGNDIDRALLDFTQAIKRRPKNGMALMYLGKDLLSTASKPRGIGVFQPIT